MLYTQPSGATRGVKALPFHLVPPEGFYRTAERFGVGAKIHGPENWKKCLRSEKFALAFARETYNHGLVHMLKMANGQDPENDHLGAIGWAQCVLAHIEEVFKKSWTSLNGEKK